MGKGNDKVNKIKDADTIIAGVPGSADEIYFAPKSEQIEGPSQVKKGDASSQVEVENDSEKSAAVAGNKKADK